MSKHFFILVAFILSSIATHAQNFDVGQYYYWEDETPYKSRLVVNKLHAKASDDNPGTEEAPFKTINAALKKVKPGQKIWIHKGIYREMLEPTTSGKDSKSMIAIEAAEKGQVIIRGSQPWRTGWTKRSPNATYEDTLITISTSRSVWFATLPEEMIAAFNPFAEPNITLEEHGMMPWSEPVIGQSPYTLKQGLIYQDGKRLVQLNHYGDVARVPGSFWVDKDNKTIHVHAFGSINPNAAKFDVAVLPYLLRPTKKKLGYIKVKGLTFEHCANTYLRGYSGAVTAMGGHHWIFEENVIREVNSSGLEFGTRAFESKDPRDKTYPSEDTEEKGHIIVRNNTIYECGTAGIRSLTVYHGLVENNEIYNCGWGKGERYWECAGIKLLVNTGTLVRKNHVHHITDGCGIWLDWNNKGSRVTQNYIHDIVSTQGGVFVEASREKNLVDNNIIWNVDGNGIYGNDSDNQLYYHNLIGNISGALLHFVVATDRSLNDIKLTCENNKVLNNIFVQPLDTQKVSANSHAIDNNAYIFTKEPVMIDQAEWQQRGFDANSTFTRGVFDINPSVHVLTNGLSTALPKFDKIEGVDIDYFGIPRTESKVYPGPFNVNSGDIELFR